MVCKTERVSLILVLGKRGQVACKPGLTQKSFHKTHSHKFFMEVVRYAKQSAPQ